MRQTVVPLLPPAVAFFAACGGSSPPPREPPPDPAPIVHTPLPWQAARAASPAPAAAPAARSAQPVATPARAANTPPPPPAAPEPGVRCAVSGRAPFPLNLPITDAGGRPIARFSGAEANLAVSDVTRTTPPRARVETGAARGAFRLRGFVEASKVPFVTSERVPIAAGHLWIAPRQSISLVAAAADGKVKIQKAVQIPLQQTFETWTTCSALSLGAAAPHARSPAGDARGFVLRKSALELFEAPQGSAVAVLYKAVEAGGVLFFSNEERGGWVRVHYDGEVIADAWAKASELSALPRGETMDQLAAPATSRGAARFAVPGSPRVSRTTRELPLRAAARDGDAPIGVIAPDTEIYVMDVVAGWASVLPKALDVVPIEGGQFWVKASELGL